MQAYYRTNSDRKRLKYPSSTSRWRMKRLMEPLNLRTAMTASPSRRCPTRRPCGIRFSPWMKVEIHELWRPRIDADVASFSNFFDSARMKHNRETRGDSGEAHGHQKLLRLRWTIAAILSTSSALPRGVAELAHVPLPADAST